MRHTALLTLSALALASCATTESSPVPAASAALAEAPAAPAGDQTAALNAFFEEYDRAQLARSPLAQAYRGIRTDSDKWDDFSDAHDVEQHRLSMQALADLRARFDPAKLDPQARLSYRLFEKQMARADRAFRFRRNRYVFDQMGGAQSQLPAFLINIHRVDTRSDAEAYVKRLQGLGPALEQLMTEAREREALDVLPPRWVFPYVIGDARNLLKGAPFDAGPDTALLADFKGKVGKLDLPAKDKEALTAAAAQALTTSVKPAYERLIALMQEQEKRAPTDDGIWRLEDGAAYYTERLGFYTTTDMDAEAVHQLGLSQVARIHEEMRAIMRQVGFKGDLQAFFAEMRTSPRFYFPNTDAGREAYLAEATRAIDAMSKRLPEAFGVLPKAALTVKRVEAFREKSAGKAFYQRPAPDGSRPGTYYVNLYDMKDMSKTEVEALAFHEGVPGHHLQLAISTELTGLPPFRRFGGFTAYSEGWGLYTEKLAKDMGFYTDPYSDFGRLQLELHRAIRLVVDTGLHAKRWSREKAIQYVKDNSADPEGGIVKAIERYIVTPGQATAYMIGRLKIYELREQARAQLGSAFDLRGFHDVVLSYGPVPLDILEENVQAWVARSRPAAAAGR